MFRKGRVDAIVGAQYGSEGKGAIVAHIADQYNIHVRTGGPNAGHTFEHEGEYHVMQTIPCGWINKHATVVIGRAALVEVKQLLAEIDHIERVMPGSSNRLLIDWDAGVIEDEHQNEEGSTKGEIHRRIGSTGKGVGAARRDRMARDASLFRTLGEVEELQHLRDRGLMVKNTAKWLQAAIGEGRSCLLEGAQGSALSLHHGHWPFVTSADTNAAQMAADCGLPPQWIDDVILVARTFPIRVAGNSGPLAHETTWEKMSMNLNRAVSEKTTVTKLVRRIGAWDDLVFSTACGLNAPSQIALTFVDYLGNGSDYGCSSWDQLSQVAVDFVERIEAEHRVHVRWIKTGPAASHIIERPCTTLPLPF